MSQEIINLCTKLFPRVIHQKKITLYILSIFECQDFVQMQLLEFVKAFQIVQMSFTVHPLARKPLKVKAV